MKDQIRSNAITRLEELMNGTQEVHGPHTFCDEDIGLMVDTVLEAKSTCKDKCDVCGHETSYLEEGIGEYEGKRLCKLCDDRIYRINSLESKVRILKEKLVDHANMLFVEYTVSRNQHERAHGITRNILATKILSCKRHWRPIAKIITGVGHGDQALYRFNQAGKCEE